MRPRTAEINEQGPQCAWCRCRPDDPMWVQPWDQAKGIACLGCVADMRYLGVRVRILSRAIFEEEARA